MKIIKLTQLIAGVPGADYGLPYKDRDVYLNTDTVSHVNPYNRIEDKGHVARPLTEIRCDGDVIFVTQVIEDVLQQIGYTEEGNSQVETKSRRSKKGASPAQ